MSSGDAKRSVHRAWSLFSALFRVPVLLGLQELGTSETCRERRVGRRNHAEGSAPNARV
jgi:hypothetical protein